MCRTCDHVEADKINRAIARGTSVRAIAKQYGLSKSAVGRHRSKCIPIHLAAAETAKVTRAVQVTLETYEDHLQTLNILLDDAFGKGEISSFVRLLAEKRRWLEASADSRLSFPKAKEPQEPRWFNEFQLECILQAIDLKGADGARQVIETIRQLSSDAFHSLHQ